MSNEKVKLWRYVYSPYSRRVEMALELKGIPYECLNMEVPNKQELFDEYNPVFRKIPILVHEGNYIAESLIILEYIDDTFGGQPLMPKDPVGRAQARFYSNFIDNKCIPTFRLAFWSNGDTQKTAFDQSKENLKVLEKALNGNTFFGGDKIGYLDIAANFIALWVKAMQEVAGVDVFNKEDYPILWKWSEDLLNSDVGKKKLPEREVLVAFFHTRKEKLVALFGKPAN